MNVLPHDQLHTLLNIKQDPCISIYMPLHRVHPQNQQNPIRLKNLIGEVENKLVKNNNNGVAGKQHLLDPVKNLLNMESFLQPEGEGLAIFVNKDIFYHYILPQPFEEFTVVTDRFYLKPLLPLLNQDYHFYLLALSQNQIKFFQGDYTALKEIPLKNAPQNLDEILKYNQPTSDLQFHSATGGGRGTQAAIFHGQAGNTDPHNEDILRYFRQIDANICEQTNDQNIPLIIAAVDYLIPTYKEISNYPLVLGESIIGNPEKVNLDVLHQRAWDLVKHYFTGVRQSATSTYNQLTATDRTSSDLREIVAAAHYGRVDTLFITLQKQQWGTFNPQNNQVEIHNSKEPGDEDLLDTIAAETILKGGTVYALESTEMPVEAPLAAILRY